MFIAAVFISHDVGAAVTTTFQRQMNIHGNKSDAENIFTDDEKSFTELKDELKSVVEEIKSVKQEIRNHTTKHPLALSSTQNIHAQRHNVTTSLSAPTTYERQIVIL